MIRIPGHQSCTTFHKVMAPGSTETAIKYKREKLNKSKEQEQKKEDIETLYLSDVKTSPSESWSNSDPQ